MMNAPLIFDLDGTLIDSKPEIISTYQKVFKQVPPQTDTQVSELDFGQPLMRLLGALYTDETEKQAARNLFLELYDNSSYENTPLYEQVVEILRYLKSKQYPLFIATNKRLSPTLRILKAKAIDVFFTEVMANEMQPGIIITKSDMLFYLKQKYEMEEAYMIGDTYVDVTSAQEVGFKSVAVLYGYERAESLSKYQPDFTISRLSELKKWF
jgi:phosphoglycolate phosphatase